MADAASKGIKKTQQAGQLRKDAAVHQKKSGVGKRDNLSRGGLSNSSASTGLNSINGRVNSSTRSSSSISNMESRNASRSAQNKQTIDKAISVAKKIPVANKYAKMAEKIRAVQKKTQGVSGAIKSKLNDGKEVSKDDIEEANRAEQAGEEYKPDAAEARYTAITSRQMRNLVIFILGGIFVGAIFFCIIILSAITDTGGHAYLASKENPSEENLEKEYKASEDNDREQTTDDDTSSNSSSSSSN